MQSAGAPSSAPSPFAAPSGGGGGGGSGSLSRNTGELGRPVENVIPDLPEAISNVRAEVAAARAALRSATQKAKK